MAEDNEKTEKQLEEERSNQNNQKNIKNAADVAMASKNPYGMAAGAAVKGLDKLTGDKFSEVLGKAVTKANKLNPAGKLNQGISNGLSESGISDLAGRGARAYNNINNAKNSNSDENVGGEKSLPSSDSSENDEQNEKIKDELNDVENKINSMDKKELESLDEYDGEDEDKKKKSPLNTLAKLSKKVIISMLLPLGSGLVFLSFIVFIIISVHVTESNFNDALGAATNAGEEIDGMDGYEPVSEEQREFLERLNNVRLSYQANGKSFNPVLVVGVFQVLNFNGANLDYDDLTTYDIEFIVSGMFNNNVYSEDTFKAHLINSVFPKYLPDGSQHEYELMAEDVIEYVDDFNDYAGKTNNNSCSDSSNGSCSYDILGYYIRGKGNVHENNQVSDLYVRLMQCGSVEGHNYGGTFGQPLAGEELVPFEKYILGVAYAEIDPDSPAEAIKAQMVAARSFILARHVDMGEWRTLREENGKWVLQAASCTLDQVYCDPDKGCSSNDGQWGQVHSGLSYGTNYQKNPLSEDSPLRAYAKETSGEVLVNDEGYIIYSGFNSDETNLFVNLANQGLNYKQILLQVYNQGDRASGASRIKKASCGNTSAGCGQVSSGEYVNWKQNEGPWINTPMGNSGFTIKDIGCLVTSVSMLIAKSGVETTIADFNPGTFVQFLNTHGGIGAGGNYMWNTATLAAPRFHYQGQIYVLGKSRQEKLEILKSLLSDPNVYVTAEVKGNTGQHWVAVDAILGDSIAMMDPGLHQTDMWATHPWYNTSTFAYYKVS